MKFDRDLYIDIVRYYDSLIEGATSDKEKQKYCTIKNNILERSFSEFVQLNDISIPRIGKLYYKLLHYSYPSCNESYNKKYSSHKIFEIFQTKDVKIQNDITEEKILMGECHETQ